MKLSTFVKVFVAALYNETRLRGTPRFRVGEILDRYSLTLEPVWRNQVLDDNELKYYVDITRHIGPPQDQRVALTPDGFRWVEDEIGENVAQFLEQHGAGYRDPSTERPTPPTSVDSRGWTGLPSEFELNEEKKASLISLLNDAERTLDSLGAGNSDKAMARAYIVAVRALADTPDPPVDLIWEIIGRANSIAGIASLFVSIIALFQVVA
ncbi:hypothetical protein [Sphingomonas sp. G-3-2-10]|uniref:hypothetical protein n=1 Tax=Sphingomonas sp. G-3-2-10 TaxID=2728838 RepID=UPI00146E78A2|nr:hypothetical protein [Sphingomonas sp. G-3-2-10]NML05098.1 hypothetical protein [Sphingomonas sp. G-3-2-10]